jgi:class 3 adenylate cyclase
MVHRAIITLMTEHPPPASPPRGSLPFEGHAHPTMPDLIALADLDAQIDSTVLGMENNYDLDQLSELTGWSRSELDELWLWAGLPSPDPTNLMFNDSDVEGLSELRNFRDREGFSDPSLASLIRAIGTTAERLAVWQVETLTKHLATNRGYSDTAARMEAAAFAPENTELMLFLVQKLWLRHYAAAIHRLTTETILRRGISDDDSQFPLLCAVGFAYIADFLDQTRNYELPNLADFVQGFHDSIADIVNSGGGRMVNNSGDFAIYVSARPEDGAEIALRIANMHNAGFAGDVKSGIVWCRVLSNYGDIFGPGVNLTRVLAREAPANTVLTDKDTAEALSRTGRFAIKPLPEVDLEGIGPVIPVQVTHA